MKINQYQVVFLIAALFLAYWVYSDMNRSTRAQRARRGEAPEFVRYAAPDLQGLPARDVDVAQWPRDLFSPPRDTEPLAPLPFEPPPAEEQMVLAPPGLGGPSPAYLAPNLRRKLVRAPAPGLFAELATDFTELVEEELAAADASEAQAELEVNVTSALEVLEKMDSPEARDAMQQIKAALPDAGIDVETQELSPSEQIATFRKLYDWIQMPSLKFGRIANSDRYRLTDRADEELVFVELEPETGKEKFPGQAAISYKRSRIEDFGFAETPANEIELARVALGQELRPSVQTKALELAHRCLEVHEEAPRALEIARDLCTQLSAMEQGQHLEARLLLARLFEVEFAFEDAFGVYNELLSGGEYVNKPEVLVAAGLLYDRLGAWGKAQTHFERALQIERSNAEAHLALGRLLLDQGQPELALPHLAAAEQAEPRGVEAKARRMEMRLTHGLGLLRLGRAQEAEEAFQRAMTLDSQSPRARAGWVEAARMRQPGERDAALANVQTTLNANLAETEFSLSLARGLLSMERGEWAQCKRYLDLAVEAGPFDSHLPLGALAYLAEITDHYDLALEYLDRALAVRPTFAWGWYTKGRLLLDQDDLNGAEECLRKALELELNFPDALVSLARLERSRSNFTAAKLYLERALESEPDNGPWLAEAGFNFYDLEEPDRGKSFFEAALGRDSELAPAGLGEAWWHYITGDSREAVTRYGEWIERRRNLGEEDPYVRYADQQSARILDHDSKEVWTDRFDRRPGRIGNGWSVKEGLGATVELVDEAVRLQGLFTGSGRTRIYNELSADSFLSMEARIKIGPEHRGANVGLFLARERTGHGGDVVVQSEVVFQRNADGVYQHKIVRRGEMDATAVDLPGWTLETNQESVWTLEKIGVGSDAFIRMYVDGEPLVERLTLPTLGSSTQVLRFGLFVEGQANRSADVTLDDVRIVRRTRP